MIKIIKLKQCTECPYLSHEGFLTDSPTYICSNKKKTLPTVIGANKTIHLESNEPPKWCPLENYRGDNNNFTKLAMWMASDDCNHCVAHGICGLDCGYDPEYCVEEIRQVIESKTLSDFIFTSK